MLVIIIIVVILILLITFNYNRKDKLTARKTFVATGENKRDAIDEINALETPEPEDNFLGAMLDADDIDTANIPQVHRRLDMAMRGIVERGDLREDDAFMVNRAADIAHFTNAQWGNVPRLNYDIGVARNIVNTKTITQKKKIAGTLQGTEAKLDVMFEPTYTADTQNVHERGVLSDVADTIANLRADNMRLPKEICMNKIKSKCARYLSPEKRIFASNTLAEVAKGNNIYALNANEDDILALVWSRSYNENNVANRKLIQGAVCDALADSVDKNTGKPVCITGRASRIVGALATLDFNEGNGKLQTREMYQNELFEDCKKLILREVDTAKTTPFAKGASIYDGGADPTDAGDIIAEKEFKEHLKTQITNKVAEYNGKVDENMGATCLTYAGISA
jgi:hypothetical protein